MRRLKFLPLGLICFFSVSPFIGQARASEWDSLVITIINQVVKGVHAEEANAAESSGAGAGGDFAVPPCPPGRNQTPHDYFGAVILTDGSKYIGEFMQSRSNGRGTITHPNGTKYVGEFEDGKLHGQGTFTFANGQKYIGEFKDGKFHGRGSLISTNGNVRNGVWKNGEFQKPPKTTPVDVAEESPMPRNSEAGSSGSDFFVSRLGHIITNQHVVGECGRVTVGVSAEELVSADILDMDRRNDLALLRISATKLASAESQFLINKLAINVVPSTIRGLMRAEDTQLGEDVLVAGYPLSDIFGSSMKVTKGIVRATRDMGDDSGQFQIDAAVQPGRSGGPIYDEYGNIVGIVVSQLNKIKYTESTWTVAENVNFGIKASTVKQFLNASGLPTKWSERSQPLPTKELAKIAESQTVMVVCHQ